MAANKPRSQPAPAAVRGARSLADLGRAGLAACLADAWAGATMPAAQDFPHANVAVRYTTTADGTLPAAWLDAIRGAGWAWSDEPSPWRPADDAGASPITQSLSLVYGHRFAPREALADQRATRWSRLWRDDPLTRARPQPGVLNVGSMAFDPVRALAWLARQSAAGRGSQAQPRRVALVWAGAEDGLSTRPAPVAVPHAVLQGLSLLVPRGGALLLAHPEGFELEPAIVADAEVRALSGAGVRVEAAYEPAAVQAWAERAGDLPMFVAVPWYPLRHYDDRAAADAATAAARPDHWRAVAGTETPADLTPAEEVAALAALMRWCLERPSQTNGGTP